MSILYNKYLDKVDYTWYDSSNILYSECYDNEDDYKSLKIVFKQGRTYLYENVDVNDYLMFRTSLSQGKSFQQYILKKDSDGKQVYKCIRLPDTNVEEISLKMKEMQENNKTEENPPYLLKYDSENGNINLYLSGKLILSSKDGKISLPDILSSLGIAYEIENCQVASNDNANAIVYLDEEGNIKEFEVFKNNIKIFDSKDGKNIEYISYRRTVS